MSGTIEFEQARLKAKKNARRAYLNQMKLLGEKVSAPLALEEAAMPESVRTLRDSFQVKDLITIEDRVPLVWWTNAPNYGDFLSPWLFGQMTQKEVVYAPKKVKSYISTGSIARRARDESIVWGSGSFGTEPAGELNSKAEYRAVRGPLTRSRLLNIGADCPRVYGDPALLLPFYFHPEVEKEYEVGLIVRWSEAEWRQMDPPPGVKLIDFGTADIAATTREIMKCKRVISSSLHGLIVADAYGIPNAWLESDSGVGGSRPKGGEFKFYDYFASVEKMRHSHEMAFGAGMSTENLIDDVDYDARPIQFDYGRYLESCPFLGRQG